MTNSKTLGKTYRVTLTLSADMYQNSINKAQVLGLTLQEYFRHLIAQDTSTGLINTTETPVPASTTDTLTKRDFENIGRALDQQHLSQNRKIIATANDLNDLLGPWPSREKSAKSSRQKSKNTF